MAGKKSKKNGGNRGGSAPCAQEVITEVVRLKPRYSVELAWNVLCALTEELAILKSLEPRPADVDSLEVMPPAGPQGQPCQGAM